VKSSIIQEAPQGAAVEPDVPEKAVPSKGNLVGDKGRQRGGGRHRLVREPAEPGLPRRDETRGIGGHPREALPALPSPLPITPYPVGEAREESKSHSQQSQPLYAVNALASNDEVPCGRRYQIPTATRAVEAETGVKVVVESCYSRAKAQRAPPSTTDASTTIDPPTHPWKFASNMNPNPELVQSVLRMYGARVGGSSERGLARAAESVADHALPSRRGS
jgi:hypothetical protein